MKGRVIVRSDPVISLEKEVLGGPGITVTIKTAGGGGLSYSDSHCGMTQWYCSIEADLYHGSVEAGLNLGERVALSRHALARRWRGNLTGAKDRYAGVRDDMRYELASMAEPRT